EQSLGIGEMVEHAETEHAIEPVFAKRPASRHIAAYERRAAPVAVRAVTKATPIEIGADVDRVWPEMARQGADTAPDVEDLRVGLHSDPVAEEDIPAAADSQHGLGDDDRGRGRECASKHLVAGRAGATDHPSCRS